METASQLSFLKSEMWHNSFVSRSLKYLLFNAPAYIPNKYNKLLNKYRHDTCEIRLKYWRIEIDRDVCINEDR